MKECYLAHARHDENGEITGGKDGDQQQKLTGQYDESGEVSISPFYNHKKGWIVFRPISKKHADKIAERAITAANNPNIGYNQDEHANGLKEHGGVEAKVKTATDCSGLVRQCIYEATGKDVGLFNTRNEFEFLTKSGLFQAGVPYVDGMKMYDGDIVVTKIKGHTAMIVRSVWDRDNIYQIGKVYTLQQSLTVRSDHVVADNTKKLKTELSEASQKLLKSGTEYAIYNSGTRITVKEVYEDEKYIWIRNKSGWICAKNKTNGKIYIK